MRGLRRYAGANAKVRSMRSRLFSDEKIRELVRTPSMEEAVEELIRSGASPSLAGLERPIDPRVLEHTLLSDEIRDVRRAADALKGPARRFLLLLLERYDVERLKDILRRRFGKTRLPETEGPPAPRAVQRLPEREILESGNIEEAVLLLNDTPFYAGLRKGLKGFKKSGNLFFLEAALENDWFRRLWRAADELAAADGKKAMELLSLEADLLNLQRISRLRTQFGMPESQIDGALLECGSLWEEGVLTEPLEESALPSLYRTLLQGRDPLRDLAFMENLLTAELKKRAHAFLSDYPFTIAPFLAYATLRRSQRKRLVSVITAKALGLEEDRTRSAIEEL